MGIRVLEHKHLLLLADINVAPTNCERVEQWMGHLIDSLDMRPLIAPKAVYCDVEGNRGMTCICAIETSHIVLHVWDECAPNKMQLDVYTCSSLNLTKVWRALRPFRAYNIKQKFYDRDGDFTEIDDTKRIEENLKQNYWHFAKTMPQIPHYYTRGREWDSIDEFAEAVDLINRLGKPSTFKGRIYNYYVIDDYKYWTMEDEAVPSHEHILINRAKV